MTARSESYATTDDMARLYKIRDVTVRRRAASGAWPAGKVGNRYRFSPEQQEEIALIVSGEKDGGFDKNRIAAALNALSA